MKSKTVHCQNELGGCLTALGRFADAEPLLLNGLEALKSVQPARPAVVRKAAERVGKLYEAWGNPEKAAESHKARMASQKQP